MRKMIDEEGLSARVQVASAATSTEEIGNPVYPPVRRLLADHGIDCTGKTARQITKRDYEEYDYIIGMDSANMKSMRRVFGGGIAGRSVDKRNSDAVRKSANIDCTITDTDKLYLLMDFTDRPGDVADPWYTRDFEATWRDVNEGCAGLLRKLKSAIIKAEKFESPKIK